MPEVEQAEDRSHVTVVTSETLADFQAGKLEKPEPVVKDEEEVKAEPEKAEAKPDPEADKEAAQNDKKEGKLNKRFSELTEQRKAAEAKAEAERVRAETAERRAAELEAKLNPPQPKADDAEPKPEQFTSQEDYQKALVDYRVEAKFKEREQKEAQKKAESERELAVNAWRGRQDSFKAATPDYEEAIAASTAKVSDQVRDAIMESEVGPQLLYHFAHNPEDAERIGKLSVGGALRELGKLEAKMEGKAPSGASKSEPEKKPVAKVEISKAPAPISPLKGANSVSELPINSKGEWTGSYQEFKAADLAGKIK